MVITLDRPQKVTQTASLLLLLPFIGLPPTNFLARPLTREDDLSELGWTLIKTADDAVASMTSSERPLGLASPSIQRIHFGWNPRVRFCLLKRRGMRNRYIMASNDDILI